MFFFNWIPLYIYENFPIHIFPFNLVGKFAQLFRSKIKCQNKNSLKKRMEAAIIKHNGETRHFFKPYVISLKSKTILKYLKNNTKNTEDFQTKIELLNTLNNVLINACRKMYNKFDPVMIYAFNNEINLAFFYNDKGEDRYDGNINKILTSIVSYASVLVSKELEKSEIYLDLVFDGHFIEFDIDHEILNYFIWRQFDCKRNTITLLYKSFYNTDDIQDLNLDDMKYTLPNVNDKLLTGNIIKKRKYKSLILNPNKRKQQNVDQNVDQFIQKKRNYIGVENFYFHKSFMFNFNNYIKTKVI